MNKKAVQYASVSVYSVTKERNESTATLKCYDAQRGPVSAI